MDRFSFEYNDGKNDIKVKMTFDVSNIIHDTKSDQSVDIFNIDSEFWHKGKKYNKDEFMKHIHETDFEMQNDFGLGAEFGFFCSAMIGMLKMRSAAAKNPEIVQNLRDGLN